MFSLAESPHFTSTQTQPMEFLWLIDGFDRYPWLLFFAIALLPGLGVPNCPLLIICGTSMTAALGHWQAIGLAVAAVIVNILWTWWVAAFPLRQFLCQRVGNRVGKYLKHTDQHQERNILTITFLLHVTPGVPLFVQNYFPGIHRLNYWKYLAIAIPVQSLYTALIVGSSGQIFLALKSSLLLVLIAALAAGAVALHRRHNKSTALITR